MSLNITTQEATRERIMIDRQNSIEIRNCGQRKYKKSKQEMTSEDDRTELDKLF